MRSLRLIAHEALTNPLNFLFLLGSRSLGMAVTSEFEANLIQSEVKLSDSNPRQKNLSPNPIKIIRIRIGFGGMIKSNPTSFLNISNLKFNFKF